MTNFSGQPYHVGDYETLASNGRIHTELRQVGAEIQQQIANETRTASKIGSSRREITLAPLSLSSLIDGFRSKVLASPGLIV